MQVAAAHEGAQLELVAATVIAVTGVQRLVDISHQVNQVLQRFQARFVFGVGRPHRSRALNRRHNTVAVRAIALRVIVAIATGKVDVVPRPGGGVAVLVSPGGK